MIRIFFKTIWNNRTRNVLVMIELFIISLVLVNLTVYLTDMIRIMMIKNSYDSGNVVNLAFDQLGKEDKAVTRQSYINLKLKLESDPNVEAVSYSNNATPYNYNLSSSGYKLGDDSVEVNLACRNVDIDYAKVMKIHPVKGRWFDESDRGKGVIKPVIVSKAVEKKYFKGNAIGKTYGDTGSEKFEIIGVVDEFKRSDIEEPYPSAFVFTSGFFSDYSWMNILVRVKPGKTEEFLKTAESESLTVLDPKIWTVSIQNSLENMRSTQNYASSQRRYIGLLIALFIMINVLLGVIGILWYNTNLRIHEIGVKRALGATGNKIRRLLVLENLFLGGTGLIVVAMVFIQIPAVRFTKVEPGIMWLSTGISMAVMILLILLSTWIPVSIASRIRPAEALKTE